MAEVKAKVIDKKPKTTIKQKVKQHEHYIAKKEPSDVKIKTKLNIVLFDHNTIDILVAECKPFAKASEFQIHYHSLQAHIKNGKFEVIVTIPLAFYNFDQEVTSGSVSMEMSDVNKISTKAKKLITKQTQYLFDQMPILNQLKVLGYDVDFTASDNGSIHRHPGDFPFSSVDYDKDPDEPGVIYRQANAINLYQTDSVIYISYTNSPKLVCTETRIVNVKKVEDNGGITGTYVECPTYSFISKPTEEPNLLFDILGSEETKTSKSIFEQFKTTTSMDFKLHEYPLVEELLKAFIACEYLPDTSNVDGKRITQEQTIHYNRFSGTKHTSTATKTKEPKKTHTKHLSTEQQSFYGNYYGEEGYDEWDYDYDSEMMSFEPKYYEPLSNEEEEEEEDVTMMIYGVKKIYNDEYSMWLPIKTKDMTETELVQYIALQS